MLNCPEKVVEIYKRVRETVDCPVLMKLRTGYDDTTQSREKFWRIMEEICSHGIDAVIIHPRTVLQRFKGHADWQLLAEAKRRFPMTVIVGSGDLHNTDVTIDRMRQSGVDGVAIARGAIGNPWIFGQLNAVINGQAKPELPPLREQGLLILEHFNLVNKARDDKRSLGYFRKFLVGYCKSHPQRRKVQKDLMAIVSTAELVTAVKLWYEIN
jgi:tRNA-dihydrouridine synthase B